VKELNELTKHIETWNILSQVEVIETVEMNIQRAITKWHKRGLTYWCILKIFLGFIQRLVMQAETESWLKLVSKD